MWKTDVSWGGNRHDYGTHDSQEPFQNVPRIFASAEICRNLQKSAEARRRDAERIPRMLISANFCKFLRNVSASVCASFSESPAAERILSRVGLQKCC